MENIDDWWGKKILIEGFIDDLGCIPLSPRELVLSQFHVYEEIPIYITDAGILITKKAPPEVEQEKVKALQFHNYIVLDRDIARSKGLLEPEKEASPKEYEKAHFQERHYRLHYFVEMDTITIPLTLEQLAAPMRYFREVDENGMVSIPAKMNKELDLKTEIGYTIKENMLYLSVDYPEKLSIDDWHRILLPDTFEHLYPKNIEKVEFIHDNNQLICKVIE